MIFIIIGCIIAVLIILYLFLLAPGRLPKAGGALWDTFYAHRGLHSKDRTIPENSLAAFSRAAFEGYGIELDIQLTLDEKVVVFHDDDLKRVCGVDKQLCDCTYEELQAYRLHKTNERIPLFTDVLALIDGRVPIIVELKNSKRNTLLCEKGAKLLDAYKGAYLIESFNPGIVRWFKKHRPGVIRGQLAAGLKDYAPLPTYQGAILTLLLANFAARPHFVAFKHEDSHHKLRLRLFSLLGGKLVGWTVRDTDDIGYCARFFDVIIFEHFKPKKSRIA